MSAQTPDWESLPAELLLKVAHSAGNGAKSMRGVCWAWKVGLEGVCTKLTIIGEHLQLSFASRFCSLRALDLRSFGPINTIHLRALDGLPLITLVLNLTHEDLTEAAAQALRDMSLAQLDLELVEGGQEVPKQVP